MTRLSGGERGRRKRKIVMTWSLGFCLCKYSPLDLGPTWVMYRAPLSNLLLRDTGCCQHKYSSEAEFRKQLKGSWCFCSSFFFFNFIHVTATVLLVVSNSLCSFPGKRKSLLKGTSGLLFLSLDLSQDFPWFHGVKALNAYTSRGIVLITKQ